jgi:hypothetical protein
MGGCVDHVFLTSALVRGEWSASRPCCFTPGRKSPRNPLDRRFGGLQSRSGRYGEEKFLDPIETNSCPLRRPARSQSLHRLSYSGLRCFTTSRNVAGSILDDVTEYFNLLNTSSRTMDSGTHPLSEMSITNLPGC